MHKLFKKQIQDTATIAKITRIRYINDAFLIGMGVLSAGIGLKGFLLPNGFLDGGAMGVSLLLQIFTQIDLGLLIVLVNFPFIIIGYKQISLEFAVKSAIAILLLSVFVHFLHLPIITADKLLIAVFGGFFLGAGIGFSIRGGAVIDGTEVLAINISRKSSLSVGDFIAIFNVVLFGIAALFLNSETAMYAMLTYLAASKTVDFIIHGIEEYIGVTIISEHSLEIKQQITQYLGVGVTVYNATAGYGKSGLMQEERKVLYCVVTRLEVTKLLMEVNKIDPEAFVIQHSILDTRGGIIKKRPLH